MLSPRAGTKGGGPATAYEGLIASSIDIIHQIRQQQQTHIQQNACNLISSFCIRLTMLLQDVGLMVN